MRERGLLVRQRGRKGVAAFLRRHRLTWGLAAAAALLLAGVGAYGTGSAAPWTLYSYWLTVMLAGALVASLAGEQFEARGWARSSPLLKAAGIVLTVTVLTTPFVLVMAALALNASWHVE